MTCEAATVAHANPKSTSDIEQIRKSTCKDDGLIVSVLRRLHSAGIQVWVEDGQLWTTPIERIAPEDLKALEASRDFLFQVLTQGPAIDRDMSFRLQLAPYCVCRACAHFAARPTARPDGWCEQHRSRIWADFPWQCASFTSRGAGSWQ